MGRNQSSGEYRGIAEEEDKIFEERVPILLEESSSGVLHVVSEVKYDEGADGEARFGESIVLLPLHETLVQLLRPVLIRSFRHLHPGMHAPSVANWNVANWDVANWNVMRQTYTGGSKIECR